MGAGEGPAGEEEHGRPERGRGGQEIHQSADVAGDGARVTQVAGDLFVYGESEAARRLLIPETAAGVCPYPGLAAFGREQARWFFGREAVTAQLLGLVAERVGEGGLAVVVAPSGAGKSSVLRAGLLPGLESGLPTAGSQLWPRRITTPTARPLEALGAQLADLVDGGNGDGAPWPEGVLDVGELFGWCAGMVEAWRAGHDDRGARLVLVVDQFEELFTLCGQEPERRAYVALLARLAEVGADGRGVAVVVLGLRADFYTRCADYEPLRVALAARQLLIGPMSREQLRQAITAPAGMVGLGLEPGLVEVLLRDLGVGGPGEGYAAGRLPFLAYALQATWQQRRGTVLTVQGYEATGGIRHAIANRAEHAYNLLDGDGQRLARTLLLRLVRVGEGTEDARRRLSRADLLPGGEAGEGGGEGATAVLDAFTRERLLSQEHDSVEITHEALLRGWPRLRQWIDENRAVALARQDVEEAAAAWDRAGQRDSSLLYRGARLETAPGTDLSPRASAFLAASRRNVRRGRRLRRVVIATVAALAVVASVAAGVAAHDENRAVRAQNQAVLNELMAEADQLKSTDAALAAQLGLIAYRMQPGSEQAVTNLVNTEDAPLDRAVAKAADAFNGMALSPDGHTVAATTSNTFQLWDVPDPAHMRALSHAVPVDPTDVVNGVAFSPNGHTLAVAGADQKVYLWDIADPAHPRVWGAGLTGHTKAVVSVAFSPDGRTLASAGQDGTVRLWNVTDPAHPAPLGQPLTGATDVVWDVVFSPDWRTLASAGGDGTLRLWDVSDPAHPALLGRPLLTVYNRGGFDAIAFSSDGRRLAGGDSEGIVAVWDTTDPAHPVNRGQGFAALGGGAVTSLAFAPGEYTLAAGTGGGAIGLYNLIDSEVAPRMSPDLVGHTDHVSGLAVSPDGRHLVSAGWDGTVRLWSLPRTRLATGLTWSLAVSSDGRTAVSGGTDGPSGAGIFQMWNITDPGHVVRLGPPVATHSDLIKGMALSHAGGTLATAGFDGVVRLWDVRNPADPAALGPPLPTNSDQGYAVAFSPDGRTLATSTKVADASVVQLWDVTNPARPVALSEPIDVWDARYSPISDLLPTLAFSPDGHILAGGGSDDSIRLWDVTDPAHPKALGKKPLSGHTDVVQAVAFSPDGRTLASGSQDHTVRLWNVADPAHAAALGQPLTGHTNALATVAFSLDGHTLASAGQDGSIRLWNVADPAAPTPLGQALTGLASIAYPPAVEFSRDGHTLISGNLDGTVRIWDLRPETAAAWICEGTGGDITRTQWNRYVSPLLPYAPPCH